MNKHIVLEDLDAPEAVMRYYALCVILLALIVRLAIPELLQFAMLLLFPSCLFPLVMSYYVVARPRRAYRMGIRVRVSIVNALAGAVLCSTGLRPHHFELVPALAGMVVAGVFTHIITLASGPLIDIILNARRVFVQPGMCHKCGYDLTSNESGTCPECGTSIRRHAQALGQPGDSPSKRQ